MKAKLWTHRLIDGWWCVYLSTGELGAKFIREGDALTYIELAGPKPQTEVFPCETLRSSDSAQYIPELTEAISSRFDQLIGWAKAGITTRTSDGITETYYLMTKDDVDALRDHLIGVVTSEIANHPNELVTYLLYLSSESD